MSVLSNIKIGKRLSMGFALTLFFAILITVIGIWRLDTVADSTRQMMAQPLAKERYIDDWYRNIFGGVRRTLAIAKSSDDSLGKFFADDVKASTEGSTILQKKIESLVATDAEKTLFDAVGVERKHYIVSRDKIIALKAAGNQDGANEELQKNFVAVAASYQKKIEEFLAFQRKTIDDMALHIDHVAMQSKVLMSVLAALMLVLGGICAWMLTTSITVPLSLAVKLSRQIAEGDLTEQVMVHSKDELGQLNQALKEMSGSLLRIVGQVREGADTIATASAEIASGNMDLSSRTEQQAGALEETASAMEELTSTVKQNADSARHASELASSASAIAVQGGGIVGQVVETMGAINNSSKKIVDIISVIDGIAFQTNILALNAAVEAARAGEQGRGFAVVASEVRGLAQRSAAAAKEIKELIGDSVNKVETGSKLVEQAGATMSEVVASVKRVTDIVGEISAASQEQSAGINEVGKAISLMDESTQQNAALVEQAAAAAKSMQDQASTLVQVVSVFKIDTHATIVRTPAIAVKTATTPTPQRSVPTNPHTASKSIATSHKPAISKPVSSSPALVKVAAAPKSSDGDWEQF